MKVVGSANLQLRDAAKRATRRENCQHLANDESPTVLRVSDKLRNPLILEMLSVWMVLSLVVLTFTSCGKKGGTANSGSPASPTAPEGFALIASGSFQMGDSLDKRLDEPVHDVTVSAFYMAKHEVTKELWDDVRAWGVSHGYTDLPEGRGNAATHPVHSIKWEDAVKWCNARSEKEKLEPCYTVSGAIHKTTTMVKWHNPRSEEEQLVPTHFADGNSIVCRWSASGYRLPTEAEWEKAARGGLTGKRFPWGDTISHSLANFNNFEKQAYQTGTPGFHPSYCIGSKPYTSPVGSFPANGCGMYDMVGNVWEWCWDLYGQIPSTSQSDPRGPIAGSPHVFRGGDWGSDADGCRVSNRPDYYPGNGGGSHGFRLAQSIVP